VRDRVKAEVKEAINKNKNMTSREPQWIKNEKYFENKPRRRNSIEYRDKEKETPMNSDSDKKDSDFNNFENDFDGSKSDILLTNRS